jgi:hypothetical protein
VQGDATNMKCVDPSSLGKGNRGIFSTTRKSPCFPFTKEGEKVRTFPLEKRFLPAVEMIGNRNDKKKWRKRNMLIPPLWGKGAGGIFS